MNGIPKYINTKTDVLNLQNMALNKLIDKLEWKKYLKGLQIPNLYRLPVLEKSEEWFKIPLTEREIPKEYEVIEISRSKSMDDQVDEYIKIKGTIDKDYLELNGGFMEAESLDLTQDEISQMIYKLG